MIKSGSKPERPTAKSPSKGYSSPQAAVFQSTQLRRCGRDARAIHPGIYWQSLYQKLYLYFTMKDLSLIHILAKLYEIQPTDRIFPYDRGWVGRQMKYGCDHSGTQKIRVHDVRHTHASLLIDMGCTPLLVAERLGHERVQTTMETYSHLYPNKQTEVAAQLDAIATKDDGDKKFSGCSHFVASKKQESRKTM